MTGNETTLFKQQVNQFNEIIWSIGSITDDIYSLNLLQSLLNGYPFVPFSQFALRPFCLVQILNDIIINDRKSIIEFGSGLSTILIGRLLVKNNIQGTVLSIEHNTDWKDRITELLVRENLHHHVTVAHAPLKEGSFSESLWYDLQVLEEHTGNRKFDMVIIDGPPAWEKGKEQARYPALPFIKDKLKNTFSIYLDDADRAGEQAVLQIWKKEFGIDYSIKGGTLACHRTPDVLNTDPF
jgi:hypothetical protein